MCVYLIEVEKPLTISNFLKKMQKRSEEDEFILILDSKVNFKLTPVRVTPHRTGEQL